MKVRQVKAAARRAAKAKAGARAGRGRGRRGAAAAIDDTRDDHDDEVFGGAILDEAHDDPGEDVAFEGETPYGEDPGPPDDIVPNIVKPVSEGLVAIDEDPFDWAVDSDFDLPGIAKREAGGCHGVVAGGISVGGSSEPSAGASASVVAGSSGGGKGGVIASAGVAPGAGLTLITEVAPPATTVCTRECGD